MNWLFFAIINVISTSLIALMIKVVTSKLKIDAVSLAFSTSLLSSIIYAAVFVAHYMSVGTFSVDMYALRYLLISIVLNSIGVYIYIKVLETGELSIVGPLDSIRPLFAVLFSIVFFSERISTSIVTGATLITLGAFLINLKVDVKRLIIAIEKSKTPLYMTIMAAVYALSSIADKMALKSIKPYDYAFFLMLGMCLAYLPLYLRNKKKTGLKVINFYIVLISVLLIVGTVSISQALQLSSPSLVVPIQMMRPLLIAVLGFVFFNEKDYVKKTLAALIMLSGSIILLRS
ncbi:MAG: EamA family transporter [Thermoproteota archaeon]